MPRRVQESWSGLAPPISALIFILFVLAGCIYIILSKLIGLPLLAITLIPVVIMLGYAALAFSARAIRLRDDQTGDNLYYMGFLFTLTSLGVALYQFTTEGGVEDIVRNFGIALTSTIAGIALRVFFNQMRRDPVEIEQTARLELADAARRVRRELNSTVIELSQFRRATQQTLREAYEEIRETVKLAGTQFADDSKKMSGSAAGIIAALDEISAKLAAMQMPDQVVEIRLQPVADTLAAAVEQFRQESAAQTAELTKVLDRLYEIQKGSEDARSYLKDAVPALERATRTMEVLDGRLNFLANEMQRRAEEPAL